MSRLVALCICLLSLATPVPAQERAAPEVTCAACVLIDDTGRVVFARAARTPRPNASTTKILTALVVRKEVGLDERVTVSARASATGGGGLDLGTGEVYAVHDLLHALLLTSSNDAAVALAEHVAGSEHAFVAEMNRLASRLGSDRSRFVTAHGLDQPGHAATALDLARYTEELLADPVLARIVAARTTVIEGPEGRVVLENRNVLLETYRGATGVKTGYTHGAGDVLVASAERDDRTLIAVAMGSVSAAADAAALLDFGWAALAETPLVTTGTPVGTLVFDPAGATQVATAEGLKGSHDPARVELTFVPDPSVAPPISAGQEVGTVEVTGDDGVIASLRAVAVSPVDPQETAALGERLLTMVLRAAGGLVGS